MPGAGQALYEPPKAPGTNMLSTPSFYAEQPRFYSAAVLFTEMYCAGLR